VMGAFTRQDERAQARAQNGSSGEPVSLRATSTL
jgi:hypothetical protein